MAKIRGLELPADYSEYLIEIFKPLPDEIMTDIGKRFLPGGIARAHLARERLAAILRSPAELEVWIYSLLSSWAPGKSHVEKLTLEGLKVFIEAMLKLRPRPSVVLPLLVDPRPEVQKYGAELVVKGLALTPAENQEAMKKEGQEDMVEFVNKWFLALAEVEASIGPLSVVPLRVRGKNGEILTRKEFLDSFRDLSELSDKAFKENAQLIRNLEEQKRKHKNKIETATRQAADEKKRLLTERDQALSRARRAEKEKAALEDKLRQVEAKAETLVTRGLTEQTSAMVRKWLEAPLALERLAQESETKVKDLIERAEEALRLQVQQDRATGNRQELEQKVEKLQATRNRLAGAASTALRPLPELKGLLAEAEEQILGIQKLLAKDRVLDPLTERLLIAINQAADPEQARQCSRLAEQAVDLELIPRADRRRLVDALQRKFSVLEELAKGGPLSVSDHGWTLRDAIYRDRPGLIILDGFNILFGMEDIFRGDYEANGRPGRRAAGRLVAVARRLTEGRKGIRVRVFFDSPDRQVIPLSENLAIEYSGGVGEHRADRRIAALLASRRREEMEEKWFVVSDDREVRRKAVASKAQPVTVDVLAVLLHDFGCLKDECQTENFLSQVA